MTKARPRFVGHYQPHLPAELGFYDLRLAETRADQAKLAREYGIDGFCYYHYWFHGKRILNRPVDDIISLGEPDFPFCLCWANESWTKNWSGENKKVLQEQRHSDQDDIDHIQWLINVFSDRRYIRVGGKPLILIYRSDLLPDPKCTVETWRQEARRSGCGELHLVAVHNNFSQVSQAELIDKYGFDAVVEFQPSRRIIPKSSLKNRIENKVKVLLNRVVARITGGRFENTFTITSVHDYKSMVRNAISDLSTREVDGRVYQSVIPSWDNSPRRKDGARVIQNTDPEPYEAWLRAATQRAAQDGGDGLIFINAWNEWAEGCHLEPDQVVGRGFLEATLRAKSGRV